jgi:hypothetical protein
VHALADRGEHPLVLKRRSDQSHFASPGRGRKRRFGRGLDRKRSISDTIHVGLLDWMSSIFLFKEAPFWAAPLQRASLIALVVGFTDGLDRALPPFIFRWVRHPARRVRWSWTRCLLWLQPTRRACARSFEGRRGFPGGRLVLVSVRDPLLRSSATPPDAETPGGGRRQSSLRPSPSLEVLPARTHWHWTI